ncbi:MAG: hypothetical protein HON65_10930 [Rhodospirillales bacterium]|nr:hypothetical protein [Rhodospirillales bacterium]
MKKKLRYSLRLSEERVPDLFHSAEEAWFWFMRCQSLRLNNASSDDCPAQFVRPCEPDDIYCAVMRLHREKMLARRHLRVLAKSGLAERPPDYRCESEREALKLWQEALELLAEVLRKKGIVSP